MLRTRERRFGRLSQQRAAPPSSLAQPASDLARRQVERNAENGANLHVAKNVQRLPASGREGQRQPLQQRFGETATKRRPSLGPRAPRHLVQIAQQEEEA